MTKFTDKLLTHDSNLGLLVDWWPSLKYATTNYLHNDNIYDSNIQCFSFVYRYQLGLHDKPVGLLNVASYWGGLIDWVCGRFLLKGCVLINVQWNTGETINLNSRLLHPPIFIDTLELFILLSPLVLQYANFLIEVAELCKLCQFMQIYVFWEC